MLLLLLVASILVSEIDGSSSTGSPSIKKADGRLPQDLSPYHYNVELRPDIYGSGPPFPFDGRVSIFFTVIKSTPLITVNSKELRISDTSIKVSAVPGQSGDPADPVVSSWTLDNKTEFLDVTLSDPLSVNTNYTLEVAFKGTMRDNGYGLYWDFYTAADGTTKYVAATQFQVHGARLAFPSFDEPAFKATFNTTVVCKHPLVSFANMPRIKTVDRGKGWLADVYDTTPKMSPYLFAIAVGDFKKLDAKSVNGYQVGILARPEVIQHMEFARKHAPLIQAWLDEETGITYREPKIDHISFPHKYNAMENWGLVTYGQQYFAISQETSSTSITQFVARFIGHETAHQWYGNLVTCKWWDDTWLNEGFSTYYNYRSTQGLGWEGSEASQVDTQKLLETDQRNSSNPVRKDIPTVWDASKGFKGSTYRKGGAMVQFLEGILTTKTFKSGLKKYLLKHQYGSVTTDDLWQALTKQAAADKITNPDGTALDVKLRMDPWLNQMGFPLISVIRKKDGTARVSQSHFLRPPKQIMDKTSPYKYRWHVPITVVSADSAADAWDAAPSAYIDIDKNEAVVSGFPKDLHKWAMINAKAMFYYRVMYDNVTFDAIVKQLLADKNAIHVESRSQFVDDAFSVARAGHFSEAQAMESTLYLAKEFKWGPWKSALRHLKYSERLFRDETWKDLHQKYFLSLAIPVYSKLGWTYSKTETPYSHFLRRDLIALTCTYGHADCLAKARSQYAILKKDPSANKVNPNSLATVLCVGIHEGTEADWQMSFDQYQARNSSEIKEERYPYLYGCTCTSNEKLLDRLLDEIETREATYFGDVFVEYLSNSDYGAKILWNYLDAKWDDLKDSNRMYHLKTMALTFSTQTELEKLNAFRERHPPAESWEVTFYTDLILDVEANVAWLKTEGPALKQWLLDHQPKGLNVERRSRRSSVDLPNSAMEHWMGARGI